MSSSVIYGSVDKQASLAAARYLPRCTCRFGLPRFDLCSGYDLLCGSGVLFAAFNMNRRMGVPDGLKADVLDVRNGQL